MAEEYQEKIRSADMRLLAHFEALPPHRVRSTLSLNQTRELIMDLAKPMVEISKMIKANIQQCEKDWDDLNKTELKTADPRKLLHFQKIVLDPVTLEEPGTVCSHNAYKDDRSDGSRQKRTIYKTVCHKKCVLANIPQDIIAHPQLVSCAAFGGTQNCSLWGNIWQLHLHVL